MGKTIVKTLPTRRVALHVRTTVPQISSNVPALAFAFRLRGNAMGNRTVRTAVMSRAVFVRRNRTTAQKTISGAIMDDAYLRLVFVIS